MRVGWEMLLWITVRSFEWLEDGLRWRYDELGRLGYWDGLDVGSEMERQKYINIERVKKVLLKRKQNS